MQMFHSPRNNYRRLGNKIEQLVDTSDVAQKTNLSFELGIDFMFLFHSMAPAIEKYLNQHRAPTKHEGLTKGLQPSAANKPTTREGKSGTNRDCATFIIVTIMLRSISREIRKMVRNRKFLLIS